MSPLRKSVADVSSMIYPTHYRVRGFSLIELMVAMAIGLFGVIVMMQVYASYEASKRSTTSGGDAMNEGITAIYALQRDVRMGGFGIADPKLLGCNLLLRAGVTLNAMAPVTINHASIPAGDGNTDTLLVVYATTSSSPQGDKINPAANGVQTPSAFAVNDWLVQAPASRLNQVAPADPAFTAYLAVISAACVPTLALDQAAAVVAAPTHNLTLTSAAALGSGNTLFNLGPRAPKIVAYAIRGGNLTVCDYTVNDCSAAGSTGDPAVWVPIASNIVSMRAEYGRDTTAVGSMLGVVNLYDQTTPATACTWMRTSAVRLALVARSVQTAGGATTAAPVWDGSANNPINLTGNPAWQNYRYKVFQTVVPIRNIAWLGAVPGC
jgi:type IV pilus assembly protein PilW